jgi:phosphoglycerate dehydrogenase-like enzyme
MLISEYVVAQIVGVERDFDRISANQKARRWEVDGSIRDHRSIKQMTIGILGVGAIGSYGQP